MAMNVAGNLIYHNVNFEGYSLTGQILNLLFKYHQFESYIFQNY